MKARALKEIPVTEPMKGLSKRVGIGPDEGAPNFVMRIFEMQPGLSSPQHSHPWEHGIYVLEGNATALNGEGKKTSIKKGDVVFIPSEEKHCIMNTGSAPFQFICMVPAGCDK